MELRTLDYSNMDLHGLDLRHRDFSRCLLTNADLRGADLRCASFFNADLTGAVADKDTVWAEADLRKAKNVPFIPMVCPSEGGFFGWKVAMASPSTAQRVLVKLFIPTDARRVSGTTRHCRCDKAFVVRIENELEVAYSINDPSFEYRVGRLVYPDSFTEDRFDNYGHGIYFFVDRAEAENYRR